MSDLLPGIDLPDRTIASLRDQTEAIGEQLSGSNRIMVFNCDHGPNLTKIKSDSIGVVSLACVGQLPPSFIDYVISRDLADGVMLTGCLENSCDARFGIEWTKQRIARQRDPHLRNRVPHERLKTSWVGATGGSKLRKALEAFSKELTQMQPNTRTSSNRTSPKTKIGQSEGESDA